MTPPLAANTNKPPVLLIIMDGFGLAEPNSGNAISLADTPVLDCLFNEGNWVTLQASGQAVGLPEGQMGNSEVGHLNIGAGRVVYQELTRINNACNNGELAENTVLSEAFSACTSGERVLHLMGLVSDGGVHSSQEHLYALMEQAAKSGVSHVYVHAFLDGRDVPPSSARGYVSALLENMQQLSKTYPSCSFTLASMCGRYFAMDRDNRWDRVSQAYEALVCPATATDMTPLQALDTSYKAGVTDEFFVPVAFQSRGIQDGDSVIFFNFRPDRARELTRACIQDDFSQFERARYPRMHFVCLTEYDATFQAPVAFPKEFPQNVMADVLADAGLLQYHIAETEKYAHVTFFLNGGVEEPKAGEERILIASPKVATYDLQPEMSAPQVASTLASAIRSNQANVYIVNFANCDMVGHTGSIPAAVAAVQAVDTGVGEVLAALSDVGGIAFITADHGNADKMLDQDGSPFTAHSTALVPFILKDFSGQNRKLSGQSGALCDIAPTILDVLGIQAPSDMTGTSLIAAQS